MKVKLIKTAEEYDVAMARMAELMDAELAPGSAEENEFELLVLVIQAYERLHEAVAAARIVEREACAKVCEDLVAQYNLHSNFICARTIRARGGAA